MAGEMTTSPPQDKTTLSGEVSDETSSPFIAEITVTTKDPDETLNQATITSQEPDDTTTSTYVGQTTVFTKKYVII